MASKTYTLGLVLTGLVVNALTALGTCSSYLAYASGDGSGLQYMFLYFGAGIAAIAGVCTAVLWATRILPAVNLLTPVLAIILGVVPEITGIGYNGSVIDRPGRIAGMILLVLHACVSAYAAWWVWRRADEPDAAAGGGLLVRG